MLVRDLIARLQTMPPDALVVQACDSEGNGYSPTTEVEAVRYIADTSWAGYLGNEGGSAVALWPAN